MLKGENKKTNNLNIRKKILRQELIARAKISIRDVKNGRITSQEVLEKESDLW